MIERKTTFSADRVYRYTLWREFGGELVLDGAAAATARRARSAEAGPLVRAGACCRCRPSRPGDWRCDGCKAGAMVEFIADEK